MSELALPLRAKISEITRDNKDSMFRSVFSKLDGVLNCIYCSSFWVGAAVYFAMNQTFNLEMVFHGFASMGTIYVVKNIFSKN